MIKNFHYENVEDLLESNKCSYPTAEKALFELVQENKADMDACCKLLKIHPSVFKVRQTTYFEDKTTWLPNPYVTRLVHGRYWKNYDVDLLKNTLLLEARNQKEREEKRYVG